jgi:hypothetical protein
MNATMLSRYDIETLFDIESELVSEFSHDKQRRLKRPHTAKRRKKVKSANPRYGIAWRRNHIWNR